MSPKLIATLKTVYIIIGGISNLISPIFSKTEIKNVRIYILPILTVLVVLPFSAEYLRNKEYDFKKPDWKDSPLNMYYPLSVFQFYAYFFLVFGLSMILGNYIKLYQLNYIGLLFVILSMGIFSAIYFAQKFNANS